MWTQHLKSPGDACEELTGLEPGGGQQREGNRDTTYLVLPLHSCNELRSLDDKNNAYFSIRLVSFFFFLKFFFYVGL